VIYRESDLCAHLIGAVLTVDILVQSVCLEEGRGADFCAVAQLALAEGGGAENPRVVIFSYRGIVSWSGRYDESLCFMVGHNNIYLRHFNTHSVTRRRSQSLTSTI